MPNTGVRCYAEQLRQEPQSEINYDGPWGWWYSAEQQKASVGNREAKSMIATRTVYLFRVCIFSVCICPYFLIRLYSRKSSESNESHMETTKVSEIQSMKTNEGHMKNNGNQGKSMKGNATHVKINEAWPSDAIIAAGIMLHIKRLFCVFACHKAKKDESGRSGVLTRTAYLFRVHMSRHLIQV